MSGDSTDTAARAAEAFAESQRKHEEALGPDGLRDAADLIEDGTAMGGLMGRLLRDRARELSEYGSKIPLT